MRAAAFIVLLLCLLVTPATEVQAQDLDEIDFNIMDRDDTIAVWFDLSPYVSSSQIGKIRDGIDLVLEYEIRLATPRRLLGESLVASAKEALRLRYLLVTEDYSVLSSRDNWQEEMRFVTYSQLRGYLADSIEVPIVTLDSLDQAKRYTVEIVVTRLTMTELTLDSPESDTTSTGSPVKFLFEQFLSITSFGRKEFSTKSREFSPSEILSHPEN